MLLRKIRLKVLRRMEPTIIVNGICLDSRLVFEKIPKSLIAARIKSSLSISTSSLVIINITFPQYICSTEMTGSRYIFQIRYWLENNRFQSPSYSTTDLYRFKSKIEHNLVCRYLNIEESDCHVFESDENISLKPISDYSDTHSNKKLRIIDHSEKFSNYRKKHEDYMWKWAIESRKPAEYYKAVRKIMKNKNYDKYYDMNI